MGDEYLQYVRNMDESLLTLTDGRYAFNMKGKDGNEYVGLFDAKLKIVCEPIPGKFFGFSCGRLFVEDKFHNIDVYDADGNKLFIINHEKYPNYLQSLKSMLYSDDVMLVFKEADVQVAIARDGAIITGKGNKGVYIDLYGDVLFENIDYSTGIEIVME